MSDPSTTSQSRAWVEVRLDRLAANALAIQRALDPGVALLPMVKADAYGLGMEPVARALADALGPAGPWGFGVATVAEGERLRAAGWQGRVVVFSPLPRGELPRAAAAGLTPAVSDLESLRAWAALAAGRAEPLPFHLEVDTGMGRAGLPAAEAAAWGAEVAAIAAGGLRWEGVFTHYHSADEPDTEPTREQWERFRAALAVLPPAAGAPRLVHTANSAASVRRGADGCDLARPGIFLYGGRAGPGAAPRPVVAVRARLVLAREVPAGATVGYGATHRATRPARWGTLAIGYGDGLPRALGPAGGEVLIRGRRVPIIGRISMDVTTVDLSGVPEAEVGDVATLIGADGGEEILLDEVAERVGTISYEILTRLSPRLPRVYRTGDPRRGALTSFESS